MGELNQTTFVTGTVFFIGYFKWKKLLVEAKFSSIGMRGIVCEVRLSARTKPACVSLSWSEQFGKNNKSMKQ